MLMLAGLSRSYDLKNGEEVQWKSRNRPIKVKLMDGTIKTVMIDESSSVEYLIELIGGKIGLEKTEEYGLQIEGAEKWLNNTQSLQDQVRVCVVTCCDCDDHDVLTTYCASLIAERE